METRKEAVVRIAERLLSDTEVGASPLGAVYACLAELAECLGVQHVVVVIEDARCGRQVFSAGRGPLNAWHGGLPEVPALCTSPWVAIASDAQLRVVAGVGAAFARALSPERGRAGRSIVPSRPTSLREVPPPVGAAVARAVRYGLGCTVACFGFSEPTPRLSPPPGPWLTTLRGSVRAGDAVVVLGEHEFGLVLEAVTDDQVPPILARVARRAQLPVFSFGLVQCPGDGSDPTGLVDQARQRLVEARRAYATPAPTIRAAVERRR